MRGMINRMMRRAARPHFCYLQTTEAFGKRLAIERMRADRTGGLFSIVHFELENVDQLDSGLAKLDRILESRLRATDDAGFFSRCRVGVLLPETPRSGAWIVARDVLEIFGAHPAKIHCEVHVYTPADSSSDFDVPAEEGSGELVTEPASDPVGAVELLFIRPMPTWRRALDVLCAGLLLLVLSPVLFAAAGLILAASGGPAVFRQRRAGIGGRPFVMYKFRTMCRGAEQQQAALRPYSEQDGPAFKMRNDPRITPVGRFLRRLSLDELPQLWNVLRGEMTLVGPRPLPCSESDRCYGWQRRRLEVMPGLTCIWQVERTSTVPFVEWMRMDLRYVQSRNAWNDLKLIAKTAYVVVARKVSC